MPLPILWISSYSSWGFLVLISELIMFSRYRGLESRRQTECLRTYMSQRYRRETTWGGRWKYNIRNYLRYVLMINLQRKRRLYRRVRTKRADGKRIGCVEFARPTVSYVRGGPTINPHDDRTCRLPRGIRRFSRLKTIDFSWPRADARVDNNSVLFNIVVIKYLQYNNKTNDVGRYVCLHVLINVITAFITYVGSMEEWFSTVLFGGKDRRRLNV